MASSSNPEPLAADHKEEEAAKKQFQSRTRYAAFLVLAIIVVMSVAVGTIWALVKPKRPRVVVENGYFINYNITHDNTNLSGRLHFDINFYNPNKKATIYFDNITASSSFSDKTGSVKNLGGGISITPQGDPIRATFEYPTQSWSIYGYMDKYLNQGRILLPVSFKAKISFVFAKWKSLPRNINIYCWPLVVFESDKDYHTFKPTVCRVAY